MNTPEGEETIFAEALRLPPEERAVFLAQVTGGNAELRQRIDSLLRGYQAGDFLEKAVAPSRPTIQITLPPTEKPGETIGRYKLLEQIGEGGCGVVYVAEQTEPVRRRVALKIIKLGMDTKSVIARFEAERQALALMDHPNIAKVFDAGTTETGRPYFVMELVRGIKITDYCDEKKLSTQARLDLFVQVCQAIQHAHQKGIIHRDIKPSNILVTVNDGVAVPKVIDFGIAKTTNGQQLTDKTIYTAFEQFIGTPAYMSPEQAVLTSLDIDTRSDIYSLGVLLYELLTGRTPFDPRTLLQAGFDEMRRIIREEDPSRPSTCLRTLTAETLTKVARHRQVEGPKLINSLRGDLDRVVMKALDKDRARRYETASAMAADVGHFLRDEPVSAVPPGVFYVTWKFLKRRRRTLAFAGALAALGLLALIIQDQRRIVQSARAAAQTDAWRSLQRETKIQRTADMAQMRLEEAEILGRVISKLSLSSEQTNQAKAFVARLAKRIHDGEASAEDHGLLAHFLMQHMKLEAPAIQSVDAPFLSVGGRAMRGYDGYTFDGVGVLFRPIVKVLDTEISKPDWIYASAGGGTQGVDVRNVITKPGVWHISCELEVQLVDDRKNKQSWIAGGQKLADYRLYGKTVRIPLAGIQRTFLKTLPADYPVEVPNEKQAHELASDLAFVSRGVFRRDADGYITGFIKVPLPPRDAAEWARPLPVALRVDFYGARDRAKPLSSADFANGRFSGVSFHYYAAKDSSVYTLNFFIPAAEVETNGIAQLEIAIRSSREVAIKHDFVDRFLAFPEIRRVVSLTEEIQQPTPIKK